MNGKVERSQKTDLEEFYAITDLSNFENLRPKNAPTLNEIILMIAKLGGFLGRKSDGYPGPKVMWIGIHRMKDFTLTWDTFNSIEDKSYV